MSNASGSGRIAYPTLAERLQELRSRGERWSDIARRIGVEEHTVITWSSGTVPNKRYWRKIEHTLDYRFAERQFAEAAAEAGFPPASAHEAVRAIGTHAAFHQFCTGTALLISQDRLAEFFGWPATSLSGFLRDDRHVIERPQIVAALRKLPQLIPHLSGEQLSRFTPRAVVGRIIREVRQRRGETPAAFAARAHVSVSLVRLLEDEGRDTVASSRKVQAANRMRRPRGGMWKRSSDRDRIIAFLDTERREIGLIAVDARDTPSRAGAPPLHPVVSRAPTAPVIDRLRAFVTTQPSATNAARALGLPKNTVHDALRHGHPKPKTLARIAAALDRVAARAPAAPTAPRAAASSADTAALPQRVADLERRMRALEHPGAPSAPENGAPSVVGAAPNSSELIELQRVIRAAAAGLARAAGITDNAERWRVQGVLVQDVEELFLQIDAFFLEYPGASGAREMMRSARKFIEEYRTRLPPDSGPHRDTPTGGTS